MTAQQHEQQEQKAQQARRSTDSPDIMDSLYGGMTPTSPSPFSSIGAVETQAAWAAYFDLAQQSLQTARRVTELRFLGDLKQQIVQEVRQQVLAEVRQVIRSSVKQDAIK